MQRLGIVEGRRRLVIVDWSREMITENVVLGKDVVIRDGARLYHVRTGDRGKINNYSILFGAPDRPATVGNDFFVGAHCYLNGHFGLAIGDRVTISPGVMIFSDSGPNTSPELQKLYPITSGRITIGSDVWIGARAIVLPGVNLGDRVVVGAQSMVVEDVPSGCMVAGTPARIIKRL